MAWRDCDLSESSLVQQFQGTALQPIVWALRGYNRAAHFTSITVSSDVHTWQWGRVLTQCQTTTHDYTVTQILYLNNAALVQACWGL